MRKLLEKLGNSIGTKIVLPYLLLTLTVAGAGAFIVTNLVTGTLQERFTNQLLDAGRVVAESMVTYEEDRLEILRTIAFTEGVPESLAANNHETLLSLVPQIAVNSNADVISLINNQGLEIYGWQRVPGQWEGESRSGTDFSQLEDVQLVLNGYVDAYGNKRVLLSHLPSGPVIFTVGPVYQGTQPVGAVLVGTSVRKTVVNLTENAIARVTIYAQDGTVLGTTLGNNQQDISTLSQVLPEDDTAVISLLQESPDQYQVVLSKADSQVPFHQVEFLSQNYLLAYGDWRLRGESFGLFSVALPSNFIVNAASTSRNLLNIVFSLATVAVFMLGFMIARRIIQPLNRLVHVSTAVSQGQLEQRTGIKRKDEIGILAQSFDMMTERLVRRNEQLVEKAGELETILNSIADGVIVLDKDDQIITSNPAAQQLLADIAHDPTVKVFNSLDIPANGENKTHLDHLLALNTAQGPQRYGIGSRVFSALAAPATTPVGDKLGRVIVLRDTTREAESEQLKDGFITSISHDLRTPLTSVKGYLDLLLMTSAEGLNEQQSKFIQRANDNTTQLIQHVEKLIDLVEVQSGTLKLQKQQESLAGLVTQVASKWTEPMAKKELVYHFEESGDSLYIHADARRLSWAIDNLLCNAHDYTMAGGHVKVRTYQKDDKACLEVVDTGIGISATDQTHLFSRFFRIQNSLTFDIPGVGLGLFIVKSIVEAHNGRVWVKSKLNTGSTFGFALPLIEANKANLPPGH